MYLLFWFSTEHFSMFSIFSYLCWSRNHFIHNFCCPLCYVHKIHSTFHFHLFSIRFIALSTQIKNSFDSWPLRDKFLVFYLLWWREILIKHLNKQQFSLFICFGMFSINSHPFRFFLPKLIWAFLITIYTSYYEIYFPIKTNKIYRRKIDSCFDDNNDDNKYTTHINITTYIQ